MKYNPTTIRLALFRMQRQLDRHNNRHRRLHVDTLFVYARDLEILIATLGAKDHEDQGSTRSLLARDRSRELGDHNDREG